MIETQHFFSRPLLQKDIDELYCRLDKARMILIHDTTIDALYITDPLLLSYYTGYSLSYGALYIERGEIPKLLVDNRYYQLCSSISIWNTQLIQRSCEEAIGDILKAKQKKRKIAFNGNTVSYANAESLFKIDPDLVLWISRNDIFLQLRRCKSAREHQAIQKAAILSEQGFSFLIQEIQEGVSEAHLAQKLSIFWALQGAEKVSFEPIIAFGPNSAIPHWRSSNSTYLKKGDIVLIDIGVSIYGYASDMTRTFSFGEPSFTSFDIWFTAVLNALKKAETSTRVGISGKEVDSIARKSLQQDGFDRNFTHGLGHGVGLDVHESPRLSQNAPSFERPLDLGDVITLEPGIYFESEGGVRLENTYIIDENGAQSCMQTPFFPRYENYQKLYSSPSIQPNLGTK